MSASLAWRALAIQLLPPSIWKTFPSSKANSIHWDLWLWLRKLFSCRFIIFIVPVHYLCVYTPLWLRIACGDRRCELQMVERTLSLPLIGHFIPELGLKPLGCFGARHDREARLLGRVNLNAESAPKRLWHYHWAMQPGQPNLNGPYRAWPMPQPTWHSTQWRDLTTQATLTVSITWFSLLFTGKSLPTTITAQSAIELLFVKRMPQQW